MKAAGVLRFVARAILFFLVGACVFDCTVTEEAKDATELQAFISADQQACMITTHTAALTGSTNEVYVDAATLVACKIAPDLAKDALAWLHMLLIMRDAGMIAPDGAFVLKDATAAPNDAGGGG